MSNTLKSKSLLWISGVAVCKDALLSGLTQAACGL